MSETVLLVDFENVATIDLGAIPDGVRVLFFFGASQKKVTREFLAAALKLGERFVQIDVEGQGKNALDFHIAFYLGEYLARSAQTRCIVLSRDKGFDSLISHLSGRRFAVRRAATLAEAFDSSRPEAAANPLDKALAWLAGTQKNKRPRKRKGLVAHLYNHFAKKIPEAQVQKFIDRMIESKKLSETGGALTYHF